MSNPSSIVVVSVQELENIIRKIFFEERNLYMIKKELDNTFENSSSVNTSEEITEKRFFKRLNHKEASKVLGVSEATLTKWRISGLVPYYQLKARGTVFYDLAELKEAFRQDPKLVKYSRK